ncbi:475_t:CDS:1, partial [Diversispora eburnea]
NIFYDTIPSDQLKTQNDSLETQNNSLATPNENIYDKNIWNFPPDAYYIEPFRRPFSPALKKYEMIMVTGASANHFHVLKSFLYRLRNVVRVRNFGLIVYDLGLTKKQRKAIQYLLKLDYLSEFRTFNYDIYPSFWDITKSRGEYGWKVGAIAEVAQEFSGKLLA